MVLVRPARLPYHVACRHTADQEHDGLQALGS